MKLEILKDNKSTNARVGTVMTFRNGAQMSKILVGMSKGQKKNMAIVLTGKFHAFKPK